MFKKADLFLIALLLLLGLGGWFAVGASRSGGDMVSITVDGKLYGRYALQERREITLEKDGGHNTVVLENSTARMKESNCAGGQCIRQGAISHSGESIVCLPHRIVVEITGTGASYDAVAS